MAKGDVTIAVVVDAGLPASVLMSLHREMTCGVAALKERIAQRRPILEARLFFNDHDEVAARLRSVVAILKSAGASFEVHELADGEAPSATTRITTTVLENVLAFPREG
jgi:hypothetical protein